MGIGKDIDLSEFDNGTELKLPWYKRLFTACVSYSRYVEQISKLRDAIVIYREESKKDYESMKEFNKRNVELVNENIELNDKLKGMKVSLNSNAGVAAKLKEDLLVASKRIKTLEEEIALSKEKNKTPSKVRKSYSRKTPTVDGPVTHSIKPVKSKNSLSKLTLVKSENNTKARISKNNKEYAYIEEYVKTLTVTEKDMMVHDILDVYANDARLSARVEKYYTDEKFAEDRYYLILRTALARKRMALKKYYDAVESFRKKGK